MAVTDFSLASSLTVSPSGPLTDGVPELLWESAAIAQGTGYNSVKVYVRYEAITPDGEIVAPVGMQLVAVVVQKLSDGSYEEIGRQNQPITKLTQGAQREILISPQFATKEEGVDDVIAGFNGLPERLKSFSTDDCEGELKVQLWVVDQLASGANPFISARISVNGQRFGV